VALSSLRERRLLGARLGAHEEAVVSHLHAAGIDPGRIERHDDNRLVQSLAASGSGIALVPALTVDRADPAVRVAPLEPPLPPRRLAVLRRRDGELSAAAGHLWDVAVSRGRRLLAA
jgi:DNA-binding transcriptional LysR family regulator